VGTGKHETRRSAATTLDVRNVVVSEQSASGAKCRISAISAPSLAFLLSYTPSTMAARTARFIGRRQIRQGMALILMAAFTGPSEPHSFRGTESRGRFLGGAKTGMEAEVHAPVS
jgi:hypothetical protein